MQDEQTTDAALSAPSKPAQRKSKTDAEREARLKRREEINKVAEQGLAQLGLRRAQGDRVWDMVNETCKGIAQYLIAPAILLPYLHNEALIERVAAANNVTKLNELTAQLVRDVQGFNNKLNQIKSFHSSRSGNSYDHDDLFAAIKIGHFYVDFYAEYMRIVFPVIRDIIDLMSQAGEQLTNVRDLVSQAEQYIPIAPSIQ